LRLEYLDPAQLASNPGNWRTHPAKQVSALRDVIDQVGWAGTLLFNERTKRLIDGHARKELWKGKGKVPVLIGSWSEAEEKLILATLDPLSAMATTDTGKLAAGMDLKPQQEGGQRREKKPRADPVQTSALE